MEKDLIIENVCSYMGFCSSSKNIGLYRDMMGNCEDKCIEEIIDIYVDNFVSNIETEIELNQGIREFEKKDIEYIKDFCIKAKKYFDVDLDYFIYEYRENKND